MHKLGKKIMDRVETKLNSQGFDSITDEELTRIKYWTCIADALTSFDYHYKIIEEMEKPENEYGVNFDENGRYYTPRRSMNRGYEHDPNMERYRDMDMPNRMYYTDSNHMGNMSNGNSGNGNRGYSESRYDKARRGYDEAKQMNPAVDNMQGMEKVLSAFEDDMKEFKPKMSANEKAIAKQKLTNLINMMQ